MEISKKQSIVFLGVLILLFIMLIVAMFLSNPSKNPDDSMMDTEDSTTDFYNITSMAGRKTYVFSPQNIRYFFTSTAEEFFSTYYSWYDSCEDFRTYAGIDENGNLILHLTEAQENAHLQIYNSGIEHFKNVPGVDIAEDYTSFTITGTEKDVSHILYYHFPTTLMFEMRSRQLYGGKSPDAIAITVNFVNSETEETMYSATWPQDVIQFDFDNPFS